MRRGARAPISLQGLGVPAQHPPAQVLTQEPTGRTVLPRCRRADGFCRVPGATEGKAVLRAAPGASLLPWAESGPGSPSDDGTRRWSRASLEGCSALSITILTGMKVQLTQTPLGQGTGGGQDGILLPAP